MTLALTPHRSFAALLIAAALLAPQRADAGRTTTALVRRLQKIVHLQPAPTVIEPARGVIEVTTGNRFVVSSFGKNDAKNPRSRRQSRRLGAEIARRGFISSHGGGNGLPKDTENGAFFAGGRTLAWTPSRSVEEQRELHRGDIGQTTDLILVGSAGSATGPIVREGPMAAASDAGTYANGGPGTYGELAALLHNPSGVIGALRGSGGVADAIAADEPGWRPGRAIGGFKPGWLRFLGAKPTFSVVADGDGRALSGKVARSLVESESRGLSTRAEKKVVLAPGQPRQVLAPRYRRGRLVASFLADDPRISPADRAANEELMVRWMLANQPAGKGKPPLVVMPATDGNQVLAARVVEEGGRAVLISTARPPAGATPAQDDRRIPAKAVRGGVRTSYLGYGDSEPALFLAQREVNQDADVVFVSSAHYHNAAGLAYALRGEAIIAVLKNRSTYGHEVPGMIRIIDPEAARPRVVSADTPAELVVKVKAVLTKRAAAEKRAAAKRAAGRATAAGRAAAPPTGGLLD